MNTPSQSTTYTHTDPFDVSILANMGSVQKVPLFTDSFYRSGGTGKTESIAGWFALRNTTTGKLLGSPPVSQSYKLVNHEDAFSYHAKTLNRYNLPRENIRVKDTVYEEGRKASRVIYFDDLSWDIDAKHNNITPRIDILNSVDYSWAFQVLAGAYSSYCRNEQVFGGIKTYQQNKKHTSNLSVESMVEKATMSVEYFDQHREQMERWRDTPITLSQFVSILEQTVCRKGGEGAALSTDRAARVNSRLLDYLTYRWQEEQKELGDSMWAAYNALTHWSTHTNETWEKQDDRGKVVQFSTGKEGSRVHCVKKTRQSAVRSLLSSTHWNKLLEAA